MADVTRFDAKCGQCGVSLFRAAEPPADEVFCLECGAGGDFKEVIEKGVGLIGRRISEEKLVDIRRKLGLSRE